MPSAFLRVRSPTRPSHVYNESFDSSDIDLIDSKDPDNTTLYHKHHKMPPPSTSSGSWFSYLSMSRGSTLYTITAIIVGTLLIIVYNLYMLPKEEKSLFFEATHNPHHLILGHKHECHWNPSNHDAVLFNIHTKLGVNYDAGHWFHMAENIMVQHSLLRRVHGLTNATKVYYNFDQGNVKYIYLFPLTCALVLTILH